MAQLANVVAAWRDGFYAYLAVRPAAGAPDATVEYVAHVPLADVTGAPKPLAQLKAELLAALTAQRQAQLAASQALAISGQVSL